MCHQAVTVAQFGAHQAVRQNLDYSALNSDGLGPGHVIISGSFSVTAMVCSHVLKAGHPVLPQTSRLAELRLRRPCINHRLNRQGHAGPQLRRVSAGHVIGDLRFLVNHLSHTVSNKLTHDRKPVGFHSILHCSRDINHPVSG